MGRLAIAAIVFAAGLAAPAWAQQSSQQNLQNNADKGIKTHNSGASGYVGEQDKPGSAAHVPGSNADSGSTGIAGAAGGKNGPPAQPGTTTGTASHNLSTQEQDTSNIKGLPGNKSGPPAKR